MEERVCGEGGRGVGAVRRVGMEGKGREEGKVGGWVGR